MYTVFLSNAEKMDTLRVIVSYHLKNVSYMYVLADGLNIATCLRLILMGAPCNYCKVLSSTVQYSTVQYSTVHCTYMYMYMYTDKECR